MTKELGVDTYLDGQRLDPGFSGIAQALSSAQSLTTESGRILTRVVADGAPMNPDLLDHPPADHGGISTLELFSEDTVTVLKESLSGAAEALGSVKEDQGKASKQLQVGQIAEAFEPLNSVLETWAAVREIVGQAGELSGIDIGRLDVLTPTGTVSGATLISDLTVRLQAVREAITGEDWGGLSDELEFEFSEQADAWHGLVNAMTARIETTE